MNRFQAWSGQDLVDDSLRSLHLLLTRHIVELKRVCNVWVFFHHLLILAVLVIELSVNELCELELVEICLFAFLFKVRVNLALSD